MTGCRSATRFIGLAAAALLGWSVAGSAPAGAADEVVVTFKPVHSLVSAVMAGVGKPYLIMKGAASPHTHRMRPSDAGVIGDARIIFMVGEVDRDLPRWADPKARP